MSFEKRVCTIIQVKPILRVNIKIIDSISFSRKKIHFTIWSLQKDYFTFSMAHTLRIYIFIQPHRPGIVFEHGILFTQIFRIKWRQKEKTLPLNNAPTSRTRLSNLTGRFGLCRTAHNADTGGHLLFGSNQRWFTWPEHQIRTNNIYLYIYSNDEGVQILHLIFDTDDSRFVSDRRKIYLTM